MNSMGKKKNSHTVTFDLAFCVNVNSKQVSEAVNSCSPRVSGAGELCHRVLSLSQGLGLGVIRLQNNLGALVEDDIAMVNRNNCSL